MKYKKIDGKTVIGLVEPVTICTKDGMKKTVMAKIDTGASSNIAVSSGNVEIATYDDIDIDFTML